MTAQRESSLGARAEWREPGGLRSPNRILSAGVAACPQQTVGDIVIKPEVCHLVVPGRQVNTPLHTHPYLEFTCIEAGGMSYYQGGRLIRVEAGSAFVMPPQVVHRWQRDPGDNLHFSFMASLAPREADAPGLNALLPQLCRKAGYCLEPAPALRAMLDALAATAFDRGAYSDVIAAAQIVAIFGLLFRQLCEQTDPGILPTSSIKPDTDEQICQRVENIVKVNLLEGLIVTDAARHVGLSERHLNRVFRRARNCSVGQHTQQLRLDQAKRLLLETSDSVKVVGLSCGFSDANYFCRFFRKRTGTTPGQFRAGNTAAAPPTPG